MSLSFINDFQTHIYRALVLDTNIKSIVSKVHIGAVQDGKCPFLVIDVQSVEDLILHVGKVYSIDFQISIYTKGQHNKSLTVIADYIIEALEKSNAIFKDFTISGMKARKFTFEKSKDLIVNRMIIDYKTLRKKESFSCHSMKELT